MIAVTRLDGTELLVNEDLVLTVEHTPDTLLTFTTGARIVVRESPAELRSRVIEFRRAVLDGARLVPREA